MTFLSPFIGELPSLDPPTTLPPGMFPWRNGNRVHYDAGAAGSRQRGQAAAATTGSAGRVSSAQSASASTAWNPSSRPVAVSTQQPQLEPQPVRIISSGMALQPASAASRISLSVTPWQRQTYKARDQSGTGHILAATENDCQLRSANDSQAPSGPRPCSGVRPPPPRSRCGRLRRAPCRRGGSNLRNGTA